MERVLGNERCVSCNKRMEIVKVVKTITLNDGRTIERKCLYYDHKCSHEHERHIQAANRSHYELRPRPKISESRRLYDALEFFESTVSS